MTAPWWRARTPATVARTAIPQPPPQIIHPLFHPRWCAKHEVWWTGPGRCWLCEPAKAQS